MKTNIQRMLLILWIVIIFVLTGYPSLETPRIKGFPIDKIYHFIVFFVLGLLEMKLLNTKGFFLLGCSVVLLAEFQQKFIPGRHFEVLDIAAGLLGLVVIYFILRLRKGFKHGLSKT